jgi:hypothetical protein
VDKLFVFFVCSEPIPTWRQGFVAPKTEKFCAGRIDLPPRKADVQACLAR